MINLIYPTAKISERESCETVANECENCRVSPRIRAEYCLAGECYKESEFAEGER